MRPGPAAIVGFALGLALILPACGDEETTAAGKGQRAGNAPETKAPAAGSLCPRQLHGFLETMDTLRSDLAVGLSYRDYLAEVNAARAAYARVPVGRLQVDCLLRAATPGERALNVYIEGVNVWGNCLAVTSCSLESIEPRLRREWAQASDFVSTAQNGLRDLSAFGAKPGRQRAGS